MFEIAPALKEFGISDLRLCGIAPSGGLGQDALDAFIRRGHSIASEFSRERPSVTASVRKGAAKRPSKPRAWKPMMESRSRASRLAAAAKTAITRNADYDKWLAETEGRTGLVSVSHAAERVQRPRTSVKDAVRAGHIPAVQVDCPPRGHPLAMVRMADVVARFGAA